MATAWTVIFEFGGKNRRISVPATTGLDDLLQLVATRWKIAVPIELLYVDSATGDQMVLDVDDDLPSLLSQNFKWKVLAAENSSSSASDAAAKPVVNTGTTAFSNEESGSSHSPVAPAVEEDKHDETLERKKDKWIELIPDDWECKTFVQKHPFFISYRQASETGVAMNLFHELRVALFNDYRGSVFPQESKLLGLHPFWDAKCLAFGQKWGVNFMSGLFHSSVIVLLCSDASMERMLEADRYPDNCLLEWELALQMKKEKGHDILPIFLSSKVTATLDDGKKALLVKNFSAFDHCKFPDLPHAHPLSPGLQTVSETVKMIMELNGPKAHPESDILKIVTEAREVYSRRMADLKTASPSSDISLSRSSLVELEKWLTPLSALMDLERQALLKNVLSGSRQWLLKKVFQFLSPDDPSAASTDRVIWLKGVAGVGKSVMAAMVSRELQAQGMLGGLFFCKHDDERRSSARNLVLTLVFGLAKFSLQFGETLLQIKQDNPEILSRSVFEMMKVLLVQPLAKVVDSKKLSVPVVLVVDALDECGAINKRNEILSVFQELNRLLPSNVKILVTGRPEEDIAKAFEKIPVDSIEPTAEENTQDQIEFTRDFLRSLNAESFLVDEGSKTLVSKSSGIFVWLVAACTYLRKSENEEITLEQIENLPEGDQLDGSIDRMYDRIFSGILQPAKKGHLESLLNTVLSLIVLAYEPLTAATIVSVLDMENSENVKRCIRMLEPILVLDGATKKIRIFHKSVKDYLMSPSRCTLSVQIETKLGHSEFASLCMHVMNKNLMFNMCNLPFSDFHSEIPDFDERVQKGIPQHVRYAVKHFWEHCFDSAGKIPISTMTQPLIEQKLLAQVEEVLVKQGHHYLEACSLLGSLDLVIPAMNKLQNIIPENGQQTMHTLMDDMKRVIRKFHIPLKASALQVYFTAIPFSPSGSEIHKTFSGKIPANVSCPKIMKGQPKDWPSCMNVLEGHSNWVNSAAFSPDGQFVVSGSNDNTVRIWNATTGEELHKLEGHSSHVNSAAYSPDGEIVVSGSDDNTVRIWNASTGQEMYKLEGHSSHVCSASFSPDGQLVVSGSHDETIRIWNAFTGQEIRRLEGHTKGVESAAFSPDGQFVVSGSNDATVRIWNTSTGQEMRKLEGHSSGVTAVAFSPDGLFVLSGSNDNKVRLWNATNGQEMCQLLGHLGAINSAAFSPDGQFVVSASGDGSVILWDKSTAQELCKLEGHTFYVHSAAFSPDGKYVVSGSGDGTVRIWNASTSQKLAVEGTHSAQVTSAAVSPDGQLVVSGCNDKTVRVWSATTGQELHQYDGHFGGVNFAVFCPDGRYVASGCRSSKFWIWETSSGQLQHELDGHAYMVLSAAFSSDGKLVVSGSYDETVRIWNASTGKELKVLKGHSSWVNSAAFSPDDQFVVSGSYDNTVRIWNATNGQELHKLEGHSHSVNSAAFSPHLNFVVSGSDDGTVRIWNTYTGQELHKLDGFSFTMSSGFTADGQCVVLKSGNGETKLIHLATALEQHESAGPAASYMPRLKHNFGARNLIGQKLQDGQTFLDSVLEDGVWFTSNATEVCCWLPPDFRGEQQVLLMNSMLVLGSGIALLIQF